MALWITLYVLFRANSKLAFPKSQFEHFAKAKADAHRACVINSRPTLLILLTEFPTYTQEANVFSKLVCLLFSLPF